MKSIPAHRVHALDCSDSAGRSQRCGRRSGAVLQRHRQRQAAARRGAALRGGWVQQQHGVSEVNAAVLAHGQLCLDSNGQNDLSLAPAAFSHEMLTRSILSA